LPLFRVYVSYLLEGTRLKYRPKTVATVAMIPEIWISQCWGPYRKYTAIIVARNTAEADKDNFTGKE
jgi:hypothetical protein